MNKSSGIGPPSQLPRFVQSSKYCSAKSGLEFGFPVIRSQNDSKTLVPANAQHDPQLPWLFTGVVQSPLLDLQLKESGRESIRISGSGDCLSMGTESGGLYPSIFRKLSGVRFESEVFPAFQSRLFFLMYSLIRAISASSSFTDKY